MIRVSVVIPVYNQAPYLAECLDSVLAQTLREIEVICVDDGSNDGSERMLDDYAKRDPRVKVIHQPNAGVAMARNNGMDAATGEFVAFMDPDDKYPDAEVLADLVCGAEHNGVDICGGSLRTFSGSSLEPEFSFAADGVLAYADYQFEFGFYRYAYRRSLLEGAGIRFPDLVRFQDVPFCVEALHAAGRFYALRRQTYCLRTGHHLIDWVANGSRRGLDNMRGLLQVHELALRYGYAQMARRIEKRALEFVGWLGSDCRDLRRRCSELEFEVSDIKASPSYRLGMFLTWPLRKFKRMLKGSK